MEVESNIPNRLFKYRNFSDKSLDMLVSNKVFFADPNTFNDPLDTKPSLKPDVDVNELENVLFKLIAEREKAEMTAAAKAIKYQGPKTIDHIFRHSRNRAKSLIEKINYDATNPHYEEGQINGPLQMLLTGRLESELLSRYDKGIFSLAESANCPLMWSHYGDQHKGICIGYSVPENVTNDVHKMKYDGNRLVLASSVAKMLDGDEEAQRKVDQAVLTNKAPAWSYEKEWRLIGRLGLQESTLELEEVVFGMRCGNAVIHAVVKALEDRRRKVRFFEINQKQGEFCLIKRELDREIIAQLPHSRMDVNEAFPNFPNTDS